MIANISLFINIISQCRRALGSVTDGSTFPPGLPRSVGTFYVLLRCDQVLLRLSSSVKVFYDETWATNGV